jgi:hypothetical protein
MFFQQPKEPQNPAKPFKKGDWDAVQALKSSLGEQDKGG